MATNDFIQACIEGNSIDELIDSLALPKADAGDCLAWKLTPRQWRACIKAALKEKVLIALGGRS